MSSDEPLKSSESAVSPDSNGSDDIYQSGKYLKKNETWHAEDSEWKAGHILNMISRTGIEPKNIADVGCGAGEILFQLKRNLPEECRFHGYDISPQAIEIAAQRETEGLNFSQADIDDIPSQSCDLIMAIDVFEHVEDFFGFLRNLKTKGTYKLFHIPLDLSVKSVLRNELMKKRRNVGHLHYFTSHTALAALKETGYEIIERFYTCTLDRPRKSLKSKLIKYPNKLLFKISNELATRLLGGYSLMVLAK